MVVGYLVLFLVSMVGAGFDVGFAGCRVYVCQIVWLYWLFVFVFVVCLISGVDLGVFCVAAMWLWVWCNF